MAGFVYFIGAQGAEETVVKIGFTRSHPDRRLAGLQIGSPTKLVGLAFIPGGTSAMEVDLHVRFADLRSHGEWFRKREPLARYIAEHASPWTYEGESAVANPRSRPPLGGSARVLWGYREVERMGGVHAVTIEGLRKFRGLDLSAIVEAMRRQGRPINLDEVWPPLGTVDPVTGKIRPPAHDYNQYMYRDPMPPGGWMSEDL